MNNISVDVYVKTNSDNTVALEALSYEGFLSLLPNEEAKSYSWEESFEKDYLKVNAHSLGVFRIQSADTDDVCYLYVRSYRELGIEKYLKSVSISVSVILTERNVALLDQPLKKCEIAECINAQLDGTDLKHVTEKDICLRHGGSWYNTEVEVVEELGVYGVWLRNEDGGVENVDNRINLWVLKAGKDERVLLKAGRGEDSHFMVTSKHGYKIRKSYDEVRAHVTNEINLANKFEDFIEDIGLRCGELERFFRNAKPGDHTTFQVGDNHDVTVIRLRNEL